MMKKFLAALNLSLGLLAFAAGLAAAQTDDFGPKSAQLNISLRVQQGCHFSDNSGAGSTIEFKPFISLDAPLQQPGSFAISCDTGYAGGKNINVALSAGNVNPGDKIGGRKLYLNGKSDGDAMAFQVYIGNSRTIWGDGSDGSQVYKVPVDSSGTDKIMPFIVELPKQDVSDLHAGTYSNIMTMAIKYDVSAPAANK